MYIENLRWPSGPICPHCRSSNAYEMEGKSIRPGLKRCRDCRKQFTVTVGTIFEDSHLPLSIWVQAFHLICASKKGISSLQLQRNLGLGSYRTAWYLSHRIRLAMKSHPKNLTGIIQVDETYVGGNPAGIKRKRGRGTSKTPVVVVVEKHGNGINCLGNTKHSLTSQIRNLPYSVFRPRQKLLLLEAFTRPSQIIFIFPFAILTYFRIPVSWLEKAILDDKLNNSSFAAFATTAI
jgi:transposase-like protein